MKKNKNISLTENILDYLKETSKNLLDLSEKILFDPEKLMKEAGFYTRYPCFTSIVFSRRSSGLKNSPYFKNKNDKIYLTEKGRIKIIKNIIKEKSNNEKWDGKWRAVIFDIPELNRKERRFLRTELKWMKFRELQKSIWICPYNIEKELFALLKLWKTDFKGDIRFLKIDKITQDKDIIKYFKL